MTSWCAAKTQTFSSSDSGLKQLWVAWHRRTNSVLTQFITDFQRALWTSTDQNAGHNWIDLQPIRAEKRDLLSVAGRLVVRSEAAETIDCIYKDIWCAPAKVKPKYPEYGRCHLGILMSFGARVTSQFHPIFIASNNEVKPNLFENRTQNYLKWTL